VCHVSAFPHPFSFQWWIEKRSAPCTVPPRQGDALSSRSGSRSSSYTAQRRKRTTLPLHLEKSCLGE
jgi:hypothetical protein